MMSVPFYDHIVIGCGGVGSGALYWLAKRHSGTVLGLEQFKLGHDHGGSQDHSRIIRQMYFDEKYTKLTPDTYKAWEEVERESGLQLVFETGGLTLAMEGTPEEKVIHRYMTAMDKANIRYEKLDGYAIRRRFPQFNTGANIIGCFEPKAGLVDAALGNSTHVQLAQAHGATVLEEARVEGVARITNGEILVRTTKGAFRCRDVIITAGAWTNHVLGSLGVHIPVTVTQEQVTYLATPNIKEFTKERFPVYIFPYNNVDFYGLPIHGNSYSKIGIDAGGNAVTPETRTYVPDPIREKICTNFLEKFLPKSVGPIAYSKTCLYTMPPDRDFVVDTLSSKGWPEVIVCCAAGHGYKFASLLGKIVSEMAIDGETRYDISPFQLNRRALTDPDFVPTLHHGHDAPEQKKSKL